MQKATKTQALTTEQREHLAYQTFQWWREVFIQGRRFLDALDADTEDDPWTGNSPIGSFVAEKLFLITAIHHAIEHLEKLDYEMVRFGPSPFTQVFFEIEKVAPLEDIRNLRNMNEHSLDYLAGTGYMQDHYQSIVGRNGVSFITNAAWTIVHSGANILLVGNIPIDCLLSTMKEQFPYVQSKTKEIFMRGA